MKKFQIGAGTAAISDIVKAKRKFIWSLVRLFKILHRMKKSKKFMKWYVKFHKNFKRKI